MNIDELETLKTIVPILEQHGYSYTAEAVKAVLEREFAKIAASMDELPPGIIAARAQRADGINRSDRITTK